MASLPQLATALQQVLHLAPLTLEATTGFCQRRSKCTAALFVQTTVLGWAANPAATLAELVGVSAACGVTLSPQALEQRLRTPAAAQLLEQVLAHVVQHALPGLPTTLLIDSEGRELGRLVGPAEWDTPEMIAFLKNHLTSN